MPMGRYIANPTSWVSLQIEAGICAVLTADTIVIGEINGYNCIVQLHSLPQFAEMNSQRYCSTLQQPQTSLGWYPYKTKHKIAVENIQWRAVKELFGMKDLTLLRLKLSTWAY